MISDFRMEVFWNTLLLIGKWLLIGLVYLALFQVLQAVRREMRLRLETPQPAAPAAPGRLSVVSGGEDGRLYAGRLITLVNDVVIGTDRGQLGQQDLAVESPYVSGRHARLHWDGVRWWVEDLGSTNGSFVDGRLLPPRRPESVPFGASLQFGDLQFELLE